MTLPSQYLESPSILPSRSSISSIAAVMASPEAMPPDDTTEPHTPSQHSPPHVMTEPSTAVNTPRASFSYFTPKRKASSSSPSSSHDEAPRPPPANTDEDEKARAQAATRGEADHGHGHKLHPSSSSPSVVVVGFEGDDDPLDPHNEPFWKKMCCTLTIAVNAFLISCFASAYLFVSPDIEESLAASRELVIVGFVTYVIMWGPGPLLWAPLSSSIGRKPVYIGAVALWTIFNIGCARAQTIGTLIGCRLLAGFFGSGCLCNGGGSNTDMFHGRSRIKATTQYSFVVFLGPVFGPLIGGAVQQYAPKSADGGWRWVFYAGIAAGTVVTIMHCLVIETNHNVRLRKRVKQLQKAQRDQEQAASGGKGMEEGSIAAPHVHYTTEADEHGLTISKQVLQVSGSAARMIVEEPIILFISLWQTTVMAVLYLFFEAYPVVFGQGHGFDSFQTGLTFFGVGCGMTAACIWGVTGELRLWERRVEKAGGEAKPEMRVPQGLAGAVFTVVGLFW